jgi:hypothetical protein
MEKMQLEYNIDKIVEHYKCLTNMGYTDKKLTQLVGRLCKDKDDLKNTMMKCSKKDLFTDKITY